MSDIFNPDIMPENDYQSNVNQSYANPLPEISATEVFYEFEKRCGNGMQYTTFANTISDEEKAKLEAKGYVVTRNTVPSSDRYGQGDLYIGFQVALNARAAEEAMQITPNGRAPTPGTSDYTDLSNKPQINDVTLTGNKSWADLGLANPMHIAGRVDTVSDLPQTASVGDVYLVGLTSAEKDEYVYTATGWEYIGASTIPVDSELSTTSENPVQNKVITGALSGKQDSLTFDNTPTPESTNPVTSGGVYAALGGKQDTISDLATIRSNATAGAGAAEVVTGIDETGNNYLEMKSGQREYLSTTVPTGNIPTGSVGMGFDEGVWTYKSGTKVSEGEPTANLTDIQNFVNSTTDTRDYFQARLFSGQVVNNQKIDSTGRKNLSIVLPAGEHMLRLRHSGATNDINIMTYNVVLTEETAFNCSFDVVGYNASTVSGLVLDNIMLNEGSTPLPYEPYGAKKFPFYANGQNLTDYTIYGNTGGVGDKTGNLFDIRDYSVGETSFITKRITLEPNTTYTMSSNCPLYNLGALIAIGNDGESFNTANNGVYLNHPISRTTDANGELIIGLRTNGGNYLPADYDTILNVGSTPLPYEPYGYKIPVICGGQTTNIYLTSPLGATDSIDYATAQVSIPTVDGVNNLICDTTVQPSKISLTYTGWHSDDTTARKVAGITETGNDYIKMGNGITLYISATQPQNPSEGDLWIGG